MQCNEILKASRWMIFQKLSNGKILYKNTLLPREEFMSYATVAIIDEEGLWHYQIRL